MGLLKIDCDQRTFKIIEGSVEKLIKLEVRYEKKALGSANNSRDLSRRQCPDVHVEVIKRVKAHFGWCMHEPTSCWLLLYMRRNFELDFQTLCWLDTYIYELIDTGHES